MKMIELTMVATAGLKVTVNTGFISHFLKSDTGCNIVFTNGVILHVTESYDEIKLIVGVSKN